MLNLHEDRLRKLQAVEVKILKQEAVLDQPGEGVETSTPAKG